ncbi:MAG TPA: HlyD family secretion protein [Bryobacteraceae bacterium]|nr:HlyD family secretion protein [Bryobacteraceae bacterium]
MSTSTQPAPAAESTAAKPSPATPSPAKPSPTAGRKRAFTIFFVILAVLATGGTLFWLHSRQFETTDDAQVEAHMNAMAARIDGNIVRVYVENNQTVKPGDPLIDLDPRDYQVALDQFQAQLAQARSMVAAQEPNIPITQVENSTNISSGEANVANAAAALGAAQRDRETAQAKLIESQANLAKAQADLARYKILIAKEEVSQQDYDQIVAAAKAQEATVSGNESALQSAGQTIDQRRAQMAESESKLSQSQRNAPTQLAFRRAAVQSEQAGVKTAQVNLEQALLRLSYTKIVAPVSGIVLQRSAEVGSRVAAGQQLLTIAQINDLWVTANFKETQLRNIKPGQSAVLHVDSLNQNFEGYIETIGAATGSVSSVLPPENATGNFVKVVQRLPVRIRFKKDQQGLDRLRPGMSVEPEVRIGG